MPAQQQHHVMSVYLSKTTGDIAVGDVLIPDAAGENYVLATLANRTANGRTTRAGGVALTPGDADNRAVEVQTVGPCPQAVTGLGAGTAGGVFVGNDGRLTRTDTGLSAGGCDADGFVYLNLASGHADATNVAVSQDVAKSAGSAIDRVRGIRGVTVGTSDGAPGIGATPVYNAVGGSSYKLKKPTNEGWYNVRDYGAVGDGVTDDLAAFEATMAAAKTGGSTGQTIYIPDGVYYLSGTLHVTESLRIRGASFASRYSTGGSRLKFAPNVTGIWLHTSASSTAFATGGRVGSAFGSEIDHLVIETTAMAAGDVPLWAPSTAYTQGQVVRCLNDNRFVYECVVAGTSGTVQPMRDHEHDNVGAANGSDNAGKQWDAQFKDPAGSGTLEWRTRTRAAIHSLVQCDIHDVYIASFLNCGIFFFAYLTVPYYQSSTSNSKITNVHVAQCGVGISVFGGDAGVCKVANCIVESCGVSGPWPTQARPITGATNASPIVITFNQKHQLNTAKPVVIAGVGGNTAANGTWPFLIVSDTQISLTGSTGNGAYTSGGTGSQASTGGYGYLDSAQYGSHWDNCNGIGNTGKAFYRPGTGFGTAVWTNPYIEGDQPNPSFNGLVLGGVWGVDSEALGVHRGYNGLTGYWSRLWVKDFSMTTTPEVKQDDFRAAAGTFETRTTNKDGELLLAERYNETGTYKGWWLVGHKSGLDDRRHRGISGQQATEGPGHTRTFRGEFRGDTDSPYYIAYTPAAKTDTFLRQAQGVGGHYLPGDRYEVATSGTTAIGEVVTSEGFASPNVWTASLNPSVHYDVLNFGRPTHSIQSGSFCYALTKSGTTGGSSPTFPTSFLTDGSHPNGGIVPYRWRASTKWKVGDYCSPQSARNGHYYKVTSVTGADIDGYVTGAASTPTFPTGSGATVVETGVGGTITWTEQGSDTGTYVADNTTEWQCVGPVPMWAPYPQRGTLEITINSGTTYTVAASVLGYRRLKFIGTNTNSARVVFPAPADDSLDYEMVVENRTSNPLTISTNSSTGDTFTIAKFITSETATVTPTDASHRRLGFFSADGAYQVPGFTS